jgi:hypothetical protein
LKRYLFISVISLLFVIKVDAQVWELKKNNDGIKVYTKKNKQSPFDLLKAECEISVSVDQMLNLIFNVSRHTEWVYNAVQSVLIKSNATYDILYYGETYAPWPVSNRDLIIHITAVTDSLTGVCTIKATSDPNLRPKVAGKIRVPRSISIWKLTPINSKNTHVTYTLDIDPGGSLPAWLVNYASVEGPYLSFLKMKEILLK